MGGHKFAELSTDQGSGLRQDEEDLTAFGTCKDVEVVWARSVLSSDILDLSSRSLTKLTDGIVYASETQPWIDAVECLLYADICFSIKDVVGHVAVGKAIIALKSKACQ